MISKPQSRGALQNPAKPLHWILQSKELLMRLWAQNEDGISASLRSPCKCMLASALCWHIPMSLSQDWFNYFKISILVTIHTYPWELFHITLSGYAYFWEPVSLAYVSHCSAQKSSALYAWILLPYSTLSLPHYIPVRCSFSPGELPHWERTELFFSPSSWVWGYPHLVLGLQLHYHMSCLWTLLN